jgi:hypothetical protein
MNQTIEELPLKTRTFFSNSQRSLSPISRSRRVSGIFSKLALQRSTLLRGALPLTCLLGSLSGGVLPTASALELDWSGNFWSEFHIFRNITQDSERSDTNTTANNAGGYYIPGAGLSNTSFQTLFFRMRPKLIVNDNIVVKSEFWLGDPVYGLFGSALPYSPDQRQYYSNQSRGAPLSAQRYWAEVMTDLGTLQVGRQPLQWGLGLVWNSGESLWSRYVSTGDAIRWMAKFGSFTLTPSVIIHSTGNTIGGAKLDGDDTKYGPGKGGHTDYSLILQYDNLDDEMALGLNIVKRLSGGTQGPADGLVSPLELATNPTRTGPTVGLGGSNYINFDLYFKKRWDRLLVQAEIPYITGDLGAGHKIRSFAVATESDYKFSDSLNFQLKAGYAPGQPSSAAISQDALKAFFFNPNYKIANILFNYQFANFARLQTQNATGNEASSSGLRSPYDNPITNAIYLSFGVPIKTSEKWTLRPSLTYARALQTAKANQAQFYNTVRRLVVPNSAAADQGNSLGIEADFSVQFQWDDNLQLVLDSGIFFPGSYYAFSNQPGVTLSNTPVFASALRLGLSF